VKGIREEEVDRTIPERIAEEVNQVAGIISKPRYFLGGRGCEDSRKKASREKTNSWRSRPRYS
jgi:hypothetical protein